MSVTQVYSEWIRTLHKDCIRFLESNANFYLIIKLYMFNSENGIPLAKPVVPLAKPVVPLFSKSIRGRYEICHSKSKGHYRLRRKAKNGQILWNSETYYNKNDAYKSLEYPGYEVDKDVILSVEI